MSADVFARNLDALRAHQHVAPELVSGDDTVTRLLMPDGQPQLQLRCLERWVSLNSRRDPIGEADQWLVDAGVSLDETAAIFVGAGLGYVLDALHRRCPKARAVIFEPEPACAKALLAHRDLSSLIEAQHLRLVVGPSYAGGDELWQVLGDEPAVPVVVTHPVLAREVPERVAEARDAIARGLRAAVANREARRSQAGRYLLNTLRNLSTIAREGDVASLDGLFRGRPAIVISAGPSLDDSLGDLAAMRDRAVFIAVDTALRPLLVAGITPDFVVSLDPSRHNAEHLLDQGNPGGAFLVAEGSSHPAGLGAFRGRTFVFRVDQHHPWPWLQSLGCDRGRLHVWGSVATAALDLARRLGCDPVVFCGQDLAYTGNRGYCSHSTWERHELALARLGPVETVDIHGRPTTTAAHLVSFRDWLVEQSLRDGAPRFVNASAAGILHGGRIEVRPLRDVLASAPAVPPDVALTAIRSVYESRPLGCDLSAAARALLDSPRNHSHAAEPLTSWRAFAGETVNDAAIQRALIGSKASRLTAADVTGRSCSAAIAKAYRDIGRARGWKRRAGLASRHLARLEGLVRERTPQDALVLNPQRGLTTLLVDTLMPHAAVHAAAVDGGALDDTAACIEDAARVIGSRSRVTWHVDVATLSEYDLVIAQLTQPEASPPTAADVAALAACGARHVRAGGVLVLVDLTDRVAGTAVRQGSRTFLAHRHDFAAEWTGHSDWFTRVSVFQREPRHLDAAPAVAGSEPARLAALVTDQLRPSSAVAVAAPGSLWMQAFAAHMSVPTSVVEDNGAVDLEAVGRHDVAVCLNSLACASDADEDRLLRLLTALSDTIVLTIPEPGLVAGPFANHRTAGYWAERFLRCGYLLSDDLRACLEDRHDLTGGSDDLILYSARKIQSSEARLAVAGSAELRALIAAAIARSDDLYFQGVLLRLDRRQLQPAARQREFENTEPGEAVLLADLEHCAGHCFVTRFDDRRLRAIHHAGLLRDATVEEDGNTLARSHSLTTEIETLGNGRYSVTSQAVFVSSSDNTDPRTNGRTYALRLPSEATHLLT